MVEKAVTGYRRFLAMHKRYPTTNLVPTTGIELAWQAHMVRLLDRPSPFQSCLYTGLWVELRLNKHCLLPRLLMSGTTVWIHLV